MGARRHKIDWATIPVEITEACEISAEHPCGRASAAQRAQAFRELARRILLRHAERQSA